MREITTKDFRTFLAEHGYLWSGYFCDALQLPSLNYVYEFRKAVTDNNSLNRSIIILDDNSKWGDKVIEKENKFAKASCENNPYTKYILQTYDRFEVYSITRDESALRDYGYPNSVNYVLEKDLSADWKKFLATNYPDYVDMMLKLCDQWAEEKLAYLKKALENNRRERDYNVSLIKQLLRKLFGLAKEHYDINSCIKNLPAELKARKSKYLKLKQQQDDIINQ